MSTKKKMIIGLGALGTLLAMPFAISSCQTTGTQHENTMMKQGLLGSNSVEGCPCTKEGKGCECQQGEGRCSCGGEDMNAGCGEQACGGE
jgi:hypothetical protein